MTRRAARSALGRGRPAFAVDTSVAIPLLLASHDAHAAVVKWWDGRTLALADHALVEAYAVLTRLPGDARVAPNDAAELIAQRFGAPILLTAESRVNLPRNLADLGIAGGAVYDAVISLAAKQADVTLATRDERARATYERIGARLEIVPT